MRWYRRKAREQDLERELRSDLEMEAAEQEENGLLPGEARYAARRALGNMTLVRERVRETWALNWLDSFAQDLRFALRAFHKSPGFISLAIIVLALGTGANTAIFSVFHAVLLRPLPFKDSDRVMLLFEKIPKRGVNRSDLCAANFFDLQQRNQTFSAMAVLSGSGFDLTDDSSPEEVPGARVSASFFSVLGVPPQLGRSFNSQDDDPGAANVVILSNELWRRRFGGDRGIVGRAILLNGRAHQVIGIMPEGFQGLFRDHELWVPMQLTPEERSNRSSHFLLGVGRLKQGVSLPQAQSEVDAIGKTLQRDYPLANAGRGLATEPVHDELVGDTKPAIVVLMVAASLLWLAACANVANLLLARALSRRKEIAVRRALGAGRQRLLRQLLTEGFLLALLGIGAGLLLAFFTLRAVPFMIPSELSLPGMDHLVIDGPVLAFAAIIGLIVTAIFGCVPGWHLFRSASESLSQRAAVGGSGSGRYHLRSGLLAIEVCLSLVLLLGAGLLIRSFTNLMHVRPGFRADRVLTAQLQMPSPDGSPLQQASFFRQIQERVRAIPGVEDVAAIEYLPLSGSGITRRLLIEGRPYPDPGSEPIVQRHLVTPDYFRTMGIPLRMGRVFRGADMNSEHLTAIINETMGRRYWPNQNPVGQYLRLGVQASVASAPLREVVGVVGDVRHAGLRVDARDEVYVPLGQDGWPGMYLVIRSPTVDAAALTPELKTAVWSVDKTQPLPDIKPMTRLVRDSVWEPRLNAVAMTSFAVTTFLLALAGIYGVMVQIVGDRTTEIGVRRALGASSGSVLGLILRQGFTPVLLGVVVGVALALAGGHFIAAQLYGVGQEDPDTFAGCIAFVAVAAFVAMAHPAVRAIGVDPMTALRNE